MTDNSFFLPGGILDEHHSPTRNDEDDDLLNMAVGFSNTLSGGLRNSSLDRPAGDSQVLGKSGLVGGGGRGLFGTAAGGGGGLGGLQENFGGSNQLPGLESGGSLLTPSLVSSGVSALGGEVYNPSQPIAQAPPQLGGSFPNFPSSAPSPTLEPTNIAPVLPSASQASFLLSQQEQIRRHQMEFQKQQALQSHMSQLNQHQFQQPSPPPGLSSPPGLSHQSPPHTSSPSSYLQPSPNDSTVSDWDDPPDATTQLKQMQLLQLQMQEKEKAMAKKLKQKEKLLKKREETERKRREKEEAEQRAAAQAAVERREQLLLEEQKRQVEIAKREQERILLEQQRLLAEHNTLRIQRIEEEARFERGRIEREKREKLRREQQAKIQQEHNIAKKRQAENKKRAKSDDQIRGTQQKKSGSNNTKHSKQNKDKTKSKSNSSPTSPPASPPTSPSSSTSVVPAITALISSDLALKASVYMSQIQGILTSCFRLISKAHSYAYISISNFNVMWPFLFPFAFQTLIKFQAEYLGSPQWAPVCLWYSFLIQNFYGESDYTSLPTSLLLWVLRAVTPIMFLMEGVSEKCFVLGLSSSELLAVSGILASIKRGHVFHPISLGFLGVYILVMSCVEEFIVSTVLQYFFFVTWLNVFYLVDHVRDQTKTRSDTEMILGI
ncbi:hypothetical protein TrVE_jg1219 [Triparma verrucosa]|uniref:Uncharacterized protein n=1 Tax=Triparma verrucosa TaxID=1606542 RepID=A0A9W7FBQ7_9STRA|nr:hypothetical protein TrVE_jg1219 [Triparma verrucosa]